MRLAARRAAVAGPVRGPVAAGAAALARRVRVGARGAAELEGAAQPELEGDVVRQEREARRAVLRRRIGRRGGARRAARRRVGGGRERGVKARAAAAAAADALGEREAAPREPRRAVVRVDLEVEGGDLSFIPEGEREGA